jgi:hypothetical protein
VALADYLSPSRAITYASIAALSGVVAACGPIAHIPTRPVPVLGEALGGQMLAPSVNLLPSLADSTHAQLARTLAPVLYLHRSEPFPLSRAVAVVHPDRRVIAYHLLWQDDAYGAWIPGTKPTDEEIVWVGYDASGSPTDMWTYWHGSLLHAPWSGRQVEVDVQWGKHGSLPRGVRESDLPRGKSLKSFYRLTYALPDLWLGNLSRKGPWCFCQGYESYRQFSQPQLVSDKLDAVIVAADPRPALRLVFGTPYSDKPWWPWLMSPDEVAPRTAVANGGGH